MSGKKNPPASASPNKGPQIKFKKQQDIPKTSLSPKKPSNMTSVFVTGSIFNLVLVRTVYPTKNNEDGYTWEAKKDLTENPEKGAALKLIKVSCYLLY